MTTDPEYQGGELVHPDWIVEAYRDYVRPSRERIEVWRQEFEQRDAERRQREREEPVLVKARRRARNRVRAVRRWQNQTREAIALKIAPWLEPEDY